MLKKINLAVGDYIDLSKGRYLILEELGHGGFGTVYKVQKEDQVYALKLNRVWELQPNDRTDIQQRFLQEYEISSTIKSAHIVKTYSCEFIHENPVLIMEYCPDGCLRQKMNQTLSEDDINSIGLQILQGLNILHTHGIIHRDIKPENILFRDNCALLTDFGISANLQNRLTNTDIRGHALKLFATLSYSPPEQSQKSSSYQLTGPALDIYSFGVIMYELLSGGKLPFGSLSDYERNPAFIEQKKAEGDWDRLTLTQATKYVYWYAIIQRCLVPNPNHRYTTVDEIIKELIHSYHGNSIQNIQWKIKIIEGAEAGKEYNLSNLIKYKNKQILTIGKYLSENPFINDIAIREEDTNFISSRHGTFEYQLNSSEHHLIIRDGQWYSQSGVKGWYTSRNGIQVNSSQVKEEGITLNNNDTIVLGKTKLIVYHE